MVKIELDLLLQLNGKSQEEVIKNLSTIIVRPFEETDYDLDCITINPFENIVHFMLNGKLYYQDKLMTDVAVRASKVLLERNGINIIDCIYNSIGDE